MGDGWCGFAQRWYSRDTAPRLAPYLAKTCQLRLLRILAGVTFFRRHAKNSRLVLKIHGAGGGPR